MKNMEKIIIEENGQLAINFEALEFMTSLEFVELIKADLKWERKCGFEVRNITVNDFKNIVEVRLYYEKFVYDFNYFKDNKGIRRAYHSKFGLISLLEGFTNEG